MKLEISWRLRGGFMRAFISNSCLGEVDIKPHDTGQFCWRYKDGNGAWRTGFSFGVLESVMTVEELINSHHES
jgi:hypothetical protein